MITQRQEDVLKKPTRNLSVKIDIINKNEQIIDFFEGVAIDGSISIDANSSYRRSGYITLVVNEDKRLIPNPKSSVWLDKRCKISVGLKEATGTKVWFNLGRFAMSNVVLDNSSSGKTLKIELKDYMSFLDGTLGGELSHQIKIPRGDSTIEYALRSVLSDLGRVAIDEIKVDGAKGVIPYDIEKPSGTTVYELAKELVDIYKGYDFYFDKNGYLIVEKIKDHRRSPVVESFNGDRKDLTISKPTTFDFDNVRNSVRVWGDQNDDGSQASWVYRNRYARDNYSDLKSIEGMSIGDICHVRSNNISYVWSDFEYIGIAISNNPVPPVSPRSFSWVGTVANGGYKYNNKYVHIKYSNDAGKTFVESGLGGWIGVYADHQRQDSEMVEDYTWVVPSGNVYNNTYVELDIGYYIYIRYSSLMDGGRVGGVDMRVTSTGAEWSLLNFNVKEDFNIENIGERAKVENKTTITNEAQARLEAEYELEQRSNFAEIVSLETVPLYHLDVNKKIKILSNDNSIDEYLITSLSIPLDINSSMSVVGRKLFSAEEVKDKPIKRIIVDSLDGRTYQWDLSVSNGLIALILEEKPRETPQTYVDSYVIRDTVTSEEYEWSMGINNESPFIRLASKNKGMNTGATIKDESTGLTYNWGIGITGGNPSIELTQIY